MVKCLVDGSRVYASATLPFRRICLAESFAESFAESDTGGSLTTAQHRQNELRVEGGLLGFIPVAREESEAPLGSFRGFCYCIQFMHTHCFLTTWGSASLDKYPFITPLIGHKLDP